MRISKVNSFETIPGGVDQTPAPLFHRDLGLPDERAGQPADGRAADAAGDPPHPRAGRGRPHPAQLVQRPRQGRAEGLLPAGRAADSSSASGRPASSASAAASPSRSASAALRRVPDLDFVVGPARVGELAQVLARRRAGERVVATGFPAERSYDFDAISRQGEHKGMVTIIEGCDKRCTFCIVPTTRGPERSRPLAEIVAEVRHLLDYGFVEIELLGQTVNHWREPGAGTAREGRLRRPAGRGGAPPGPPPPPLRHLLPARLHAADGGAASRGIPDLCNYLHLPVQSGSDRVLAPDGPRLHRRRRTASWWPASASARPDLALSTDLIVGFPGETEDDFAATLGSSRSCRFSSSSPSSTRPGRSPPPRGSTCRVAGRGGLATPPGAVRPAERHPARAEPASWWGRRIEVLVTGWGPRSGHPDRPHLLPPGGQLPPPAPTRRPPAVCSPVRIEARLSHSLTGTAPRRERRPRCRTAGDRCQSSPAPTAPETRECPAAPPQTIPSRLDLDAGGGPTIGP